MATLAAQQITNVGVVPTFAAAAVGGDNARPGPNRFLVIKNGGTTITATIVIEGTLESGVAYPDATFSVVGGSEKWILLTDLFAEAADHLAHVTYSSNTSITVGLFSL